MLTVRALAVMIVADRRVAGIAKVMLRSSSVVAAGIARAEIDRIVGQIRAR